MFLCTLIHIYVVYFCLHTRAFHYKGSFTFRQQKKWISCLVYSVWLMVLYLNWEIENITIMNIARSRLKMLSKKNTFNHFPKTQMLLRSLLTLYLQYTVHFVPNETARWSSWTWTNVWGDIMGVRTQAKVKTKFLLFCNLTKDKTILKSCSTWFVFPCTRYNLETGILFT